MAPRINPMALIDRFDEMDAAAEAGDALALAARALVSDIEVETAHILRARRPVVFVPDEAHAVLRRAARLAEGPSGGDNLRESAPIPVDSEAGRIVTAVLFAMLCHTEDRDEVLAEAADHAVTRGEFGGFILPLSNRRRVLTKVGYGRDRERDEVVEQLAISGSLMCADEQSYVFVG